MTKVKNDYNIEDIIEICQTYLKDDLSIIKEAYLYAKDYLEENELQNLLNISYVLTTVLADTETMASVFIFKLFKLVERKALEEKFSIPIVNLAFGIYKLDKIEVSTENDYLIEYYKKVIVGMSEDVRVIIVTLAIRLNIMRTLDKDNVEENKKIAKETLEIFARGKRFTDEEQGNKDYRNFTCNGAWRRVRFPLREVYFERLKI